MKLYAMQVPVESQESPFDTYGKNDLYEDAIITGNTSFREYTTESYYMFIKNYDELWSEYHRYEDDKQYESFEDAVNLIMLKDTGEPYSEKELKRWEEILNKYDDWYNMDKITIAECLYMITDMEYHYKTIRGSVQSEWQGVFYTEQIDIKKLEADYFNLGTEWCVIESEEDYDDAEDLPSEVMNYIYCYGYNNDIIKSELSEISGVPVENITLFEHQGYIHKPVYKRY